MGRMRYGNRFTREEEFHGVDMNSMVVVLEYRPYNTLLYFDEYKHTITSFAQKTLERIPMNSNIQESEYILWKKDGQMASLA